MGARFIGCDRDQVFLMPPSVRDWVPDGHLVWTVLDAVAKLDLSAIYADYRDDGRGRPAYEPSMMVALLLYAYARGSRSWRGIERACIEDVAYHVVTGNHAPRTIRRSRSSVAGMSGRWPMCSRACWGCARGRGWCRSAWWRLMARRSRPTRRWTPTVTSADPREILAEAPRADRREASFTAASAATGCPSICARARGAARRCARPRSALPASATTLARRRLTTSSRRQSSSISGSSSPARRVARVGARGPPRAGSPARARGPPDRQGPCRSPFSRRAGAWRKSSTRARLARGL